MKTLALLLFLFTSLILKAQSDKDNLVFRFADIDTDGVLMFDSATIDSLVNFRNTNIGIMQISDTISEIEFYPDTKDSIVIYQLMDSSNFFFRGTLIDLIERLKKCK